MSQHTVEDEHPPVARPPAIKDGITRLAFEGSLQYLNHIENNPVDSVQSSTGESDQDSFFEWLMPLFGC